MTTTYYLDESGNTGDLAQGCETLNFGNQPLFVLACLGCDNTDGLTSEIDRLKTVHKIQAPELKSASLASKPQFVTDLVRYLDEHDCPILVEVVDKRYFILAYMVSLLVLTPLCVEIDYAPDTVMMKNLFAEYLHRSMPAKILDCFLAACDAPSAKRVRRTLNSMKDWLAKQPAEDQIARGMLRFVQENEAELTTEQRSDGNAYRRFLPEPDNSKYGAPVWILPNQTSFSNIYGRVNLLHQNKIGDVILVHDEQIQFEHILRDNKTLAEKWADKGSAFALPNADYRFLETAKLEFAASHASAGIQAADAIAGFVMRYVKQALSGGQVDALSQAAFFSLRALAEPERGVGINFVLSYTDIGRMGITSA